MAQNLPSNVDWQKMPRDLALIRMENDSIQAMALSQPRDHKKVLSNMASQLDAYPSFARMALYSKPVGRKPDTCAACGAECRRDKNKQMARECWKCSHKKIIEGPMQFAKGLSIRAAEGLAEAYGFCRVRADVELIGDDKVKITATFTDFATGRIWEDNRVVSRHFRYANGSMGSHSDDRFFNVVIPAEKSKLIREVVNRSVPPGLRSELEERVEKALEKLLDDKTISKIIDSFGTKHVSLGVLERFLGAAKAAWTHTHREQLLTVWNAIKDGETDVAELFDFHRDDFSAEPPDSGHQDNIDQTVPPSADEMPVTATPEPDPQATGATAAHFMRPKGMAADRPPNRPQAAALAAPPVTSPATSYADQRIAERYLREHAERIGLRPETIQLEMLIGDALAMPGTIDDQCKYITDIADGLPGINDYSLPASTGASDSPPPAVHSTSSPSTHVEASPPALAISDYVQEIVKKINKSQRITEISQLVTEAIEFGITDLEKELLESTQIDRVAVIRTWNSKK